jgi:hypothetical protein
MSKKDVRGIKRSGFQRWLGTHRPPWSLRVRRHQVQFEYIICPVCKRRTGVARATGQLRSESLPESFEITCPHCLTTPTILKSSIQSQHARKELARE